jgi:hypothetical protein
MICGILTDEQKELVTNQMFNDGSYFNPVKDNFDNWVIFEQEMDCKYPEFAFVTTLPLIEFVPIPRPELS